MIATLQTWQHPGSVFDVTPETLMRWNVHRMKPVIRQIFQNRVPGNYIIADSSGARRNRLKLHPSAADKASGRM
jgi:hypothetical protein